VIRLITSVWFDRLILFVILANSIVLGLTDHSHIDKDPSSENYGNPMNAGSWRNTVSSTANNAFTYVFAAEMALKIVAMGFVIGEGTYLKDGWNVFDFFVVVTSLIALLPSVPSISIFRSFRVLRPLRNVSALPGLRKLISAFLSALPELGTVILLLSFLFMIFSVLGLSLFAGSVDTCCRLTPFPVTTDWMLGFNYTKYRCLDAPNVDLLSVDFPTQSSSPWHTPQECYWPTDDNDQRPCAFPGQPGNHQCYQSEPYPTWCGSNWDAYGNPRFKGGTTLGMYGDYYFSKDHLMAWGTFNSNNDYGYTTFDNFFRAYITVFESVTLENWSWIMYMHRDTNPPALPAIFFIIFAMIGANIGLNLLLAVLEENFVLAKKAEIETKAIQLEYTPFLNGFSNCCLQETKVTVIVKQDLLDRIVASQFFARFVTCIVIFNTAILCSDHYPSTDSFDQNVSAANFTCTLFFLLDMALKIAALGIREYCNCNFNLFDGLIVILSILELCMTPPQFISAKHRIGKSKKGLSAFRFFRLLRPFKLAKQWKVLTDIMLKMSKTIDDLGYLLLLLLIFMYISGLIGMEFFANRMCFDSLGFVIPLQDPKWSAGWVPRANYNTLTWSLFNTFNIMTSENWNNIMYDGWRATESGFSFIYFMLVVVLGQLFGMDMFLAIVLSNFSVDKEEEELAVAVQIKAHLPVQSGRQRADTLQDLEALVRTIVPDPKVAKQREPGFFVFPLFSGKTLFIFGPTNPIRETCAYIVSYRYFDSVILVLIVISSVCLAIDDPLMNPDTPFMKRLEIFDICLTSLFCLEMVLKIIALGFFFQPRAYLRSSWNILDFVVVFVSLSAIIPSNLNNTNLKALRALRAFRAFRPLRMVSRVPSLKKVVDTLVVAIPGVGDVMAITMFFFVVFGIVCVNLFKGGMRKCALGAEYTPGLLYDPVSNQPNAFGTLLTYPKSWNYLNLTEKAWFGPLSPLANMSTLFPGNCSEVWPHAPCCTSWPEDLDASPTSRQICECWGSSWNVWWGYWTFDNIGEAILSLYQISSTEGWVYLMLESVDQNGVGMQPIRNNNLAVIILFSIFILLVNFFAINLVVGVILENFQRQTIDEEFLVLTEAQQIFVKTHKIVATLRPFRKHNLPKDRFRQALFRIVEHSFFEVFIMGCILANTLTMAMQHRSQSDAFTLFLSIADYFFCGIFTLEAVLKLGTFGWKYFGEGWNRFDFVIVVSTDLSLIVDLTLHISVGPIAQVVRSFRVGRILRLLNGAKSLHMVIETLFSTMIGLANICALWLLILFIFAVLGNQLYAKVALPGTYNVQLNAYYNFQTFTNSLVTLFSFSGGEYWNGFSMALGSRTPDCIGNPPFDPAMCGFTSSLLENPQNGCKPLNGCGNVSAIPFMCLFYLVTVNVMLNLCVGIIVDEFTNQKPNQYLTVIDFRNFNRTWSEFDPDATFFIDYKNLYKFVTTVAAPWNVDSGIGEKAFYLKAVSWKLNIYKGNKVHFYDLLHILTKEVMHQKLHHTYEALPKSDQNFEDALTKIYQAHHLNEIEPEKVNGVEIGVMQNYRIQTLQKIWKERRALANAARTFQRDRRRAWSGRPSSYPNNYASRMSSDSFELKETSLRDRRGAWSGVPTSKSSRIYNRMVSDSAALAGFMGMEYQNHRQRSWRSDATSSIPNRSKRITFDSSQQRVYAGSDLQRKCQSFEEQESTEKAVPTNSGMKRTVGNSQRKAKTQFQNLHALSCPDMSCQSNNGKAMTGTSPSTPKCLKRPDRSQMRSGTSVRLAFNSDGTYTRTSAHNTSLLTKNDIGADFSSALQKGHSDDTHTRTPDLSTTQVESIEADQDCSTVQQKGHSDDTHTRPPDFSTTQVESIEANQDCSTVQQKGNFDIVPRCGTGKEIFSKELNSSVVQEMVVPWTSHKIGTAVCPTPSFSRTESRLSESRLSTGRNIIVISDTCVDRRPTCESLSIDEIS